jgi:acyl dehydratase
LSLGNSGASQKSPLWPDASATRSSPSSSSPAIRCASAGQYRREYDEGLKDWKKNPLHDWTSIGFGFCTIRISRKARWRRSVIEWFDDLTVGMRYKSPERVVTREEIKRFASEFDPQPFHLDEAAAEQTPLKGLAASGWHTAAIAMRLAVEMRPFGPHPLLGIGLDELRWLAPLRPGDKLHLEGEVVELTPSKTKPQGIIRVKWTLFNQHGTPIYTFTSINIVPRRPA